MSHCFMMVLRKDHVRTSCHFITQSDQCTSHVPMSPSDGAVTSSCFLLVDVTKAAQGIPCQSVVRCVHGLLTTLFDMLAHVPKMA